MAKTLLDRYYAAAKRQQQAKAALLEAEKKLREIIAWHSRNEQLFAALSTGPINTIYLIDTVAAKWEFGYWGGAVYKVVASAVQHFDASVAGTKTNTQVLWEIECDEKAANNFMTDYPDISRYNLLALANAQVEARYSAWQYAAAIMATNTAGDELQEERK